MTDISVALPDLAYGYRKDLGKRNMAMQVYTNVIGDVTQGPLMLGMVTGELRSNKVSKLKIRTIQVVVDFSVK